ncbi:MULTISPECIES: tyrosine-type recombinase/integrase [Psychrobacter]|uniref:tyrosine-type recombinase/integrase n=1 Tax=Psychrobacter TaxID=497 RepID=UPI001625795D|nr:MULTISPECIES: tyrosine-type recombinase/integrase [Psychrobacter]|tara:strand:+ start:22318 stop:25656 length:3339 start_codon:yes stop_codon:yes gene_type:complete
MLINEIKLPKIIDDLAKFDGRKKRYVPYPSILKNSDTARTREIKLLADLQTEWESLKRIHPGSIGFIQSFNKYYQQALWPNERIFSFSPSSSDYFDLSWLSWSQSLSQFQIELYRQLEPLSQEGFDEFQSIIENKIAKAYESSRTLKHVWQVVVKFVDYQNKYHMLAEHHYPKIIAPQPTKINPLITNTAWLKDGKALVKIIRAVEHNWEQTVDYSQDQIIGWLIFSGIVYGGINEVQMLQGWLTSLLAKEYQPFIKDRIMVSPRFVQKRFGNEREEESDQLYNTKQIVVDVVSQCWLMRYHKKSSQAEIKPIIAKLSEDKIKQYLTVALSDVINPLGIKPLPFSRFLYYASYYWEELKGTNIDHASVGVLRGMHNTAGLSTQDFGRFLNQKYQYKEEPYDLEHILTLSISKNSVNQNETSSSSSTKKIEVRKSDLIMNLTKDFKMDKKQKKKKLGQTTYTLIERVQKRYGQYDDLSEKILLDWVLSLLNRKESKSLSNESILKYIRTIGYEWLYFTTAQPLDIWSEEEFEELYEDILEYKAVVRNNTDIGYSANLLKSMHNFAKSKYNLPSVNFQHSKNGRRVRAELISPQAYKAIITQILGSVDILEREMFALLFILVYRTGMRKKELLGLKYSDIEGLKAATPSVVIRPNSYRPTKTQSSIRRIALFALLKPDELNFFINFVQSNIGSHSNKFIFTLSSDQRPIDDHVPLQLLKRVLKDMSVDHNVAEHTFHGFRHTAVSNLSLALLGHPDLVEALTDYDENDILRIKKGLLGEHIDAQDRWYALSGVMGHLSPERSFEYYNHFATLMATYALSIADIKLPEQTLCNITEFPLRRIKDNADITANGMVSIPSMRKLLFKSIIEGKRKSPQFTIENCDKQFLLSTNTPTTDELFGRYGLNRVQLLLQTYDKEVLLSKAAQLANISMHDANILIKRASEVADIATKRGKSRFVKLSDSKNSVLSPLNIQYQSDLRLLSLLLSNAYRLREKSGTDWTWFIEICREKLSVSRAYLPFRKEDKKELQRFIGIAEKLLPLKRWLVSSNKNLLMETMSSTDYQDIKQQSNDSKNALHIGIASQDHRERTNKWQYSPLLRFFVHMMLITDETLSIAN